MTKTASKIFSFIKKNLTIIGLFLVWLAVTIPNLNIYWMLVDDGVDVVVSRTLFEKLSSFNLLGFVSQLLENGTRFRPAYWLYQMIVWLIGGNSYQFQHFAHMIVIGITMLFIYLIIKELTKSKMVSFFGALIYLLIPINSENIFRLGPQEPLLVIFLSILFYLVIKNKKIILPCLVLLLAVFTKETSLALLPVLFFYYFYGRNNKFIKNKKQGFHLVVLICILSVAVILMTLLRRGVYGSNYYFNIPMFAGNLLVYLKELSKNTLFVFPLVFIVYLIRKVITLFKKPKTPVIKQNFFEFIFFLGFLCFLIVQLPWRYVLSRYLMPTVFFLIIFSCLEIYQDLMLLGSIKLINNYKRIYIPSLAVIVAYICLVWGFQLVFNETAQVSYEEVFRQMANYPKNTILLMNVPRSEGTIELIYETQIQLSEFWNRSDLKVDYLDLQNLPQDNYVIVGSGQFLNDCSQGKLGTLVKCQPTIVKGVSRGIVITTPLELIKQSIKKLFNLLVYKKQPTSDGLYSYYYNYNNWYFYSN